MATPNAPWLQSEPVPSVWIMSPKPQHLCLAVCAFAVPALLVSLAVHWLTQSDILPALAGAVVAAGIAVYCISDLSHQLAAQRQMTEKKFAAIADANEHIRRTLELVRTSSDPRLDTLSMNTISQNLSRIDASVSAVSITRAGNGKGRRDQPSDRYLRRRA